MRLSKEDRLKKVEEKIEKEKSIIENSKEKIKLLNKERKTLEQEIADEKFSELSDYLSEFGIKTVEQFENFFENRNSQQNNDQTN